MCFSATASYAAGIGIGVAGIATLRLVPDRRQRAFAALPLVFGFHQVLEGVIWQQVDAATELPLRTPAVELWLLIAWTLFPIWVPLSVRAFEPDADRRRWMLGLAVVGGAVGGFLAVVSMVAPATVSPSGHHLQYAIPVDPGWPLAIPYIAATCLPLLLSSHRFVLGFGVVIVGSILVTALLDTKALTSVWCFFAALLSIVLFVHYARLHARAPEPAPAS